LQRRPVVGVDELERLAADELLDGEPEAFSCDGLA